MAWNRPDVCNDNLRQKPVRKSAFLSRRFALIVVLLLGCIAGVAYLFVKEDKQATSKEKIKKSSDRIQSVTPANSGRQEVEPEKDYSKLTSLEIRHIKESETNLLTDAQIQHWRLFHPWPPPDKNQPKRTKARWEIFETKVDNQIAGMLAVEPGTQFFGDGRALMRGFDKRFLKSLSTPIIVRETDSDYDKVLKRSVVQAKAELKSRLDAGEDITQIMLDTRDELQKLGRYRADAEKLALQNLRKSGVTAADADDIITAVNTMLESKGIAPIQNNQFSRLGLEVQRIKSKETEK